jgi:hypothetical protein
MAYEGSQLELRQSTPIPFSEVNLVTEKIDGLAVEGSPELQAADRELQGRKFVLYHGSGTAADGAIVFSVTGLPHSNPLWRYLAAGVSVLLLLGFGIYGAGGTPHVANAREKLEQRRDHLMEELAALEQKGGGDAKRQKKREELTDKLAKLYKELDEVGA